MIVVLVALLLVGLIVAAARFGADSRQLDSRATTPNWPGMRHSS